MNRLSSRYKRKIKNGILLLLISSLALVYLIKFCETNLRFCLEDTSNFYEEKRAYVNKTRKLKKWLLEKYSRSNKQENIENKNLIEVALVSVGFKNQHKFILTVSSILKQTNSKILFHLIGDRQNFDLIQKIIKSHGIKHDAMFYDFNDFFLLVAFYPNAHPSGVFPMMKLLIPDILPLTTSKVIVVDPGFEVNDEIFYLWFVFDSFNADQMIGALEVEPIETQNNLINYYKTDVMLMDLMKMRKFRWYWFWKGEILKAMLVIKELRKADEDVINLLAMARPEIFKKI